MRTRPRIIVGFVPLILSILLVVSTTALPVLNFNSASHANYLLTAQIQSTQSCVAVPANFSGIACQNFPPAPVFISVGDNGFSPSSTAVSIGQV